MKKLYAALCTCLTLFFLIGNLSFAQTSSPSPIRFGYIHGVATSDYSSAVDATNHTFNRVSPVYFGVNKDGTLDTKSIDSSFIDHMHSESIEVIPRLTAGWDQGTGEKALANADQFTSQLAQTVSKYNLDGINVDFENLADTDAAGLVHFVSLLKQKLGTKEVSVAVAVNPNGWTKGWQASYDYKGLANACDYLILMAYDETQYGDKPGPVAGYPFIVKSITYAINQGVPKDKIVVALPSYGRMWSGDRSTNGSAVYTGQITDIMKYLHPTITYLQDQQTAVATFNLPVGSLFRLNSWSPILPAGTYTVYYDNAQSLSSKLALVNSYGLGGVAVWSVGLDTPSFWTDFKNGLTQSSVPAQSTSPSSGAATTSTGSNSNSGTTSKTGTGASSNSGASPSTGTSSNSGTTPSASSTPSQSQTAPSTALFQDVSSNYWAYQPIKEAVQLGLMKGVNSTHFEPNRALTRAEAATILVHALNLKEAYSLPYFKDVPSNYWAYGAIQTVYQHKIFNGDQAGDFNPQQLITRQEMAAVLYNLIGGKPTISNPFSDVKSSDWAYTAILSMKQQGIFNGHTATTFGPQDTLTRAQTAVLFTRLHDDNKLGN